MAVAWLVFLVVSWCSSVTAIRRVQQNVTVKAAASPSGIIEVRTDVKRQIMEGMHTVKASVSPSESIQVKTDCKPHIMDCMRTVKASVSPSGLIQAKVDTKSEAKNEIVQLPNQTTAIILELFIGAIAIPLIIFGCYMMHHNSDGSLFAKSYEKVRSGLSASSNDIASTPTNSTDRELKTRMEKFEQHLEEQVKQLQEAEAKGSEVVTASTSFSKESSERFKKLLEKEPASPRPASPRSSSTSRPPVMDGSNPLSARMSMASKPPASPRSSGS